MNVDERLRAGDVVRAVQHARELHLPEAASTRRRRRSACRGADSNRRRRPRDRSRTRRRSAGRRSPPPAVKSVSYAVVQSSSTRTPLCRNDGPVRAPTVLALRRDRREQERETRRRRRRVLDDGEVLVPRVDQVVERGRRGRPAVVTEPRRVVDDAHVALVDRRDAVLRVDLHRRRAPSRDPRATYGSKMPASSARVRNVLSTPNSASATGLSLRRIASFTITPASPGWTSLTL